MTEDKKREYKEWYTQKEIYEMMQDLREDLAQTRTKVSGYNDVKNDVEENRRLIEKNSKKINVNCNDIGVIKSKLDDIKKSISQTNKAIVGFVVFFLAAIGKGLIDLLGF